MDSEEFVEDRKMATKNKNKILEKNEKSKTKEKTDPAGSGLWRYKGYKVCKPLDV